MESRTRDLRPRPRTQKNPEAKAKDTGASVLKKKSSKFFSGEKGLQKFFSGDEENKKRSSQIFREVSGVFQHFNGSKNSAVFEPRTGQFLRT